MNTAERMIRAAILRCSSLSLCLAVLLFISGGSALGQSMKTHHVRDEVKNGEAKFLSHLASTQILRLNLALPLRDEAGLDELLLKLYDPASSLFHQFLSVQEFTARFGPMQQDYDAVVRF